jgi:hypothetical protein
MNISFFVMDKWLTKKPTTQNAGIEVKTERTAANETASQRKAIEVDEEDPSTTSSKQSKRKKVL